MDTPSLKSHNTLKQQLKFIVGQRLNHTNKVILELFIEKFFEEDVKNYSPFELKNAFSTAESAYQFFHDYIKNQDDASWDAILQKKNN